MSPFSMFLHPTPDVFTVFGPNNQSYWLLLFVRYDLLNGTHCVYYISVALEMILSCFGYVIHGRSIYTLMQHKILHLNLLNIWLNLYCFLLIASLVRLVLLVYETRLIPLEGLVNFPIPLLCTIRLAVLIQCLLFLPCVGLERLCASIFVANYEKHRRLHISIILIASLVTMSMTLAYFCVTGLINCYTTVVLGFLPNVITASLHPFLLKYNKRRHRLLNEAIRRHAIDEYSLSLRVQLKENIWSLEKVEFGLYILTAGVLFEVLIIFVPAICFAHSMETIQLWTCVANVGLAISIAASAPAGPVVIAMHTGRHPRYLRWYLGESRSQNVSDGKAKHMDVYFMQLHKQWDYSA